MKNYNSKPVTVPIIYYHSIGTVNKHWVNSFLTLKLKYFNDQLKYYSKHFNTIHLKEYWKIRNNLQAPTKSPLVITFDDGYLDNWIWAFPLLKKYNLKATIFVNPEFVDPHKIVRPNLENVWLGSAGYDDLNQWGFLSWDEMRIMEETGLVDIQSHTMSHTKYFVSDRIIDFHRPGADILYPAGNLFPERKPYYISDPDFEKLLPYGYPLFEDESAVIAKKVSINQDFTDECIELFRKYNFENYGFSEAFNLVKPVYESFKSKDAIIKSVELEQDYKKRLKYEICDSKEIIEKKLNKKVEFLCWPHGDNNARTHQLALEAGYLATTLGSKQKIVDTPDRISARIGLSHSRNNRSLSRLKTKYKINSYMGKFPYSALRDTYQFIRYGKSLFTH